MPSDSQQSGYCMKIRKQFGQDWRNWNQRALLPGMEDGAAAVEDRTVLLKKNKIGTAICSNNSSSLGCYS